MYFFSVFRSFFPPSSQWNVCVYGEGERMTTCFVMMRGLVWDADMAVLIGILWCGKG